MHVQIDDGPAFAFAEITLPPGGSVRVESGAMASQRGDVTVETSTRGGFMKGLRRAFGGESFFVNDFTSAYGGTLGIAPALPGDIAQVHLPGGDELLVQSGGWLASDLSVEVDSSWGGARGFFSGAGLILLRCSGQGDLLVAAYGGIRGATLAPGERMVIDTGHVVAFESTVQYSIRKAGNWKTTFLGGEGLVAEFIGPGQVFMQTRSTSDLISWLDARLPRHDSSNN
ncbi:TIGR00266 family protein [Cellulomonas rhizosphaerae]|uniref:TIGR00266 family protein n=1 Tax=Cellulomonas rhizosphaerae TaxID=2293719 RepID=UPI0018F659A0|nr:TIGR00266 family protein [Cellulomonas rhizosphaerae]